MAIIGQITLDQVSIFEVDTDPSLGGGTTASIGSMATLYDGANGRLWIKSGAGDTAWSIIPRLATATAFTAGSIVFADASGFLSQNNTQLYWDNTNFRQGIGIATPQSRLHIDSGTATASAIKLTVGATTGTTPGDGFDVGVDTAGNAELRQRENSYLTVLTNNTTAMTVTSNQKTLLSSGVASLASASGEESRLQIQGLTSVDTQAAIMRYSADNSSGILRFTKSRGVTLGAHAVLAAADNIGSISFRASDGVNFFVASAISGVADAATTTNSTPGRLMFYTTPTGSTTSVERMRIDNGGRVIIGTGAVAQDITGIGAIPWFQIIGQSAVQMAGIQFSADTIGPVFNLLKSRNATLNTQGLVLQDDEFGRLQFRASDGVNFQAGASVRALVDGTAAAGSMPGRLILMTTPAASVTPVERMRIDNTGNVSLGNIAPTRQFDITGQMRIRGGNPRQGMILQTPDTTGNADWVDPYNINGAYHFVDDFISDANAGVIIGQTWTIATNGGVVSSQGGDVNNGHPGVALLNANSNGDNPTIYMSATGMIVGNGLTIVQWLINTPAALPTAGENYVSRIGLGDNIGGTTADFVDGVYFELPVSGTTTWQCKTSQSSTRTTVNSGVTVVANTWYLLEMRITTTSVQYYINGNLVATINTNIPTGGTQYFGPIARISKTNGSAVDPILVLDAFRLSRYYANNRY